MTNFKTLAVLCIGFAPLAHADTVLPNTIRIFSDQAAFMSAAGAAHSGVPITNNDASMNTLSHEYLGNYGDGSMVNNVWSRDLFLGVGNFDGFYFPGKPMYAFGGTFNYLVGSDLLLVVEGVNGADIFKDPFSTLVAGAAYQDSPYPYTRSQFNSFFGVISDQPFGGILIQDGQLPSYFSPDEQAYTLSGFVTQTEASAPTPEPSTFMLAGLALLMVGVWRKRALAVKAAVV